MPEPAVAAEAALVDVELASPGPCLRFHPYDLAYYSTDLYCPVVVDSSIEH